MRRLAAGCLAGLLAACQGAESPRPQLAAAAIPVVQRSHVVAVHDDTLKADIARRIAQLGSRPYRAVTVEAWNGRVLLAGAVIKPEQRRRAEQAARAASGTGEVLNELVLAEDGALDLFLPDTVREVALRRQLGLDGEGAPVLRVVHGVAFLLGAARGDAESEALKEAVGDAEGIKWVVNHLRPGA